MRAKLKTEHAGAKGSQRKSGHWGRRVVAKTVSRKGRRNQQKQVIRDELKQVARPKAR